MKELKSVDEVIDNLSEDNLYDLLVELGCQVSLYGMFSVLAEFNK